ncbi:hypothetical protein [Brevundimonas naejangsanensis]|uniref:hypothetical protein n=1 Tax=Brevundimonas naejangsanensis TaxID=588932 RepID=UPI0026EB851E|nr:hypothetical protein [Brevundimonas naejangsanensis]
MTPDQRKAARKAAQAEAERKRKRALDRLDGVELDKPEPLDPEPDAEVDPEAAEEAFAHGSIAPVTSEEAFMEARAALLDVSTPTDRSEKAKRAEAAARLVQGFSWAADELGLPPHMPVRPLGKRKSHMYFLDPNDEFVELSAGKLNQQGEIDNLFGPAIGYLWSFYGKQSSNGELRIKYEDVRRHLTGACGRLVARTGLFDPMRKVRGRGAWRTDGGVLVLHLGSRLWIGGVEQDLGEVEGHVYARDVDLSPPASAAMSDELASLFFEAGLLEGDDRSKAPGRWMLKAMKTWNWKRPELDPRLVLGYVVCVFLGAALRWRPAIYPIGDKASGKSSLLALVKAVLGDRLMDLADPSGPGIYQSLGLAAIGVWADEFEQEGESAADARAAAVMRLARYASDGKNVVRGGAEGVPTNYQARGTFGFTGINPPPMKPAELSRIAMPMLSQLTDASAKAPELSAALGDELGRHMLRRIVDRWHEWPDVLTAWRGVLLSHGHDSRAADTFGTLLAASHLVLDDGVPLAAQIDPLAKHLPRATMNETQDDRANWEKCIDRLLQAQPDAWRQNKYRSVGEFLTAVLDDRPKDDVMETTPMAARDRLATAGLGLCTPTGGPLQGRLCLAVPSNHVEVAKLFERSLWAMGVGAVQGGWATALKFAPEDVVDHRKQRVDGRSVQCSLLALDKVIDVAGDGEAQTQVARAA